MSVRGVEPRVYACRPRWRGLASLATTAFALAGCAPDTPQVSYSHGHEHFAQSKYGHASAKVVADGQPVPHGGGQYLVGHPYSIAGHRYYPAEDPSYSAVGMASWYGAAFHGRRTANGEVYDMASLSAAHPTMPLPSYARVTNLGNGYSVMVRVNDRGPYHGGRVMDVSSRVAEILDMKAMGTARVKVEYVGPAPIEGSDDSYLLASLRTDGSPAQPQSAISLRSSWRGRDADDLRRSSRAGRREARRPPASRAQLAEPRARRPRRRQRPSLNPSAWRRSPKPRRQRPRRQPLTPTRSRSASRAATFHCRRRVRSISAPIAAALIVAAVAPPSSAPLCRRVGPSFRRARERRSTSPSPARSFDARNRQSAL